MAVAGIALLAFSLRSAVASFSPVLEYITADFPVSSLVVGLIGTAPPVCFAAFGLATPALTVRWGLERTTVAALALIVVGLIGRAVASDAVWLLALTSVIFAGVAIGNVVLPALVKKHFPDRLGAMMTLYTTAMALAAFLPPLLAVPLAEASSWRLSLGLWAALAVAGLIPWITILLRERMPDTSLAAAAPPVTGLFGRLARLLLPWSLVVIFAISAIIAYVGFAWLPVILIDHAGTDAHTAGALLSLFAAIGLPCSLLVPILVVRFHATIPLYLISTVATVAGILGLLLAPDAALVLWVVLFGTFGVTFPLSLVLISIRVRDHRSAVALSGFVQSIGYAAAAFFPFLTGVLYEATGGWEVPLLMLLALMVISVPFGMIAGRRTSVEDAWERRHGAW